MGPKAKVNKKTEAKKQDRIIEDKTFGLKNKNKSKQVQKYIKQVTSNVKSGNKAAQEEEKRRAEKKAAKLAKMQADEELRALFNEALDGSGGLKKSKTKKDKQKEQAAALKKDESSKEKLLKDYPFIADEMLAMTGMLSDMSPEELDAELQSFMATGKSDKLTLEQVIELQRAKMRSEGRMGTPVTEESLARWKADRAARKRAEIQARVDAEMKKKKGGKGLSVLSGKDLFAFNQSLFVDDDEADDEKYDIPSDAEDEEDERPPLPPGAAEDRGAAAEEDPAEAQVTVDDGAGKQIEVALQENLYLEGSDDDLDDLDDLDDD